MKKLIFILLGTFFFIACSNEDFENAPKSMPSEETGNLEFIYQGVMYSTPFYFDNDSIPVFEDVEVGKIYEEINGLPNVAILVSKDKPNEYFDDYENLQKELSLRFDGTNSVSKLRAAPMISCEVKLYDKANYSGRMVSFTLMPLGGTTASNTNGANNLNYYPMTVSQVMSFDNVLTSVTIKSSNSSYNSLTATFFDNPYYQGKSLTYSNFNTLNEADFSKYQHTKPGFFRHSKDWNEVISSILITWN